MKRPSLVRVVPAALALVLVLFVAYGHWERVTSDLSPPEAANISRLQRKLADLRELGCSIQGRFIQLGERSSEPYGTITAGRPEACLSCLCSVKTSDVEPEPDCVITECPTHVCDRKHPHSYEPDHPCCAICNTTEPVSEPTAEPARSRDPAIPLTRAVYEPQLLHEPAAVCAPSAGGGGPLALLGVTSRPRAAERRALFRRLYGAQLAAARIRYVFVLGREERVERALNQLLADEEEYEDYMPEELTPDELAEEARQFADRQAAVDAESARHGDILQSRAAEHYNHLSLKTLALLEFAGRHCRRAAFVIKTDDDVLVTVRRLAAEVAARAGQAHRPSIHGLLCVDCAPYRGRLLAWRSSHREWPWDRYPAFVTGPGYLVSAGAVQPLLARALDTPYHHLEDVFLTGIVAEAAGVERHDWAAQCINRVRGGDLCSLAHCALSHADQYKDGGRRMELFGYATRRFDVDRLCEANVTTATTSPEL
ncbi:uncharacterized protein LOC122367670 [Amphibalanus amphitrite]|uniref:uncharacterized protein LOC122367670 n=1 Tax=Amphibalanus amphitrite TaxID=1232801 RepID=UPI001C90BB87|nr:uncharacterized protein LOC122367670 [Amphibalanus amphitrite]